MLRKKNMSIDYYKINKNLNILIFFKKFSEYICHVGNEKNPYFYVDSENVNLVNAHTKTSSRKTESYRVYCSNFYGIIAFFSQRTI
jgi:hypothetical protein